MNPPPAGSTPAAPLQIERWPTEVPLRILVILASVVIWLLLALSIFGIIYALLIGMFLLVSHLIFIAYIRGSAVRLGPDQMPQLYQSVLRLTERVGLEKTPEVYLLQSGGTLNALATRFLGSELIVLYSDLLEACGDNSAARDMVIGHELAHHHCGHLRWAWLLAPGLIVPFLGTGYSRACEFTCDRYGAAACGDLDGALFGMAVLAAGGEKAQEVNLKALARQREALDTGAMTIGKWLMRHPPLCERVAALQPALLENAKPLVAGPARAIGLLMAVALIPILLGALAVGIYTGFTERLEESRRQAQQVQERLPADVDAAIERDFQALAAVVAEVQRESGQVPTDSDQLLAAWERLNPGQPTPTDPYDGLPYGYFGEGDTFYFWSSGPDGINDTEDDIFYFPEED